MCLCVLCDNSDYVMPVLGDNSDAYILVKGNIRVANTAVAYVNANNKNINVIFKNCAPFTDCMSEINNTQVDNAKDIDAVMLMYNLIGYYDNYFKISGSLWQYCRDEPALGNNNGNIVEFSDNNATDSFKLKEKITGQADNDSTKDVEIMVLLKHLKKSFFWIILEIYLIDCEINLILTWSADCVIKSCAIDQSATFAVTDKKRYVPIVTLSTEDNVKLLQRLKSGFKKAINWNKYQSKVTTQAQNQYLIDYLIDPTFQGVNRLFV